MIIQAEKTNYAKHEKTLIHSQLLPVFARKCNRQFYSTEKSEFVKTNNFTYGLRYTENIACNKAVDFKIRLC